MDIPTFSFHGLHIKIFKVFFRLRDLDGNSKCLKLYKDSYSSLDEWVQDVEEEQIKAQENKPEDSKALAELLNKQKVGQWLT